MFQMLPSQLSSLPMQTLQEIAAALQYLHRNDVLHGDLTGGNVLLTASDKDTRGFTAKVGCYSRGAAGLRAEGRPAAALAEAALPCLAGPACVPFCCP